MVKTHNLPPIDGAALERYRRTYGYTRPDPTRQAYAERLRAQQGAKLWAYDILSAMLVTIGLLGMAGAVVTIWAALYG